MKVAFFILALITIAASVSYEDLGLIPFNGGQYLLSSFNSSWADANNFCKSIGFSLLDVETESENKLVLKVFGAAIPNRVWIGGSDFALEGEFYWGQTMESFNYTAWHDGEPSGTSNVTGVKEDCVHFRNMNGTILWNDAQCERQYQFICEVTSTACLRK